jgi:hypothetical protein
VTPFDLAIIHQTMARLLPTKQMCLIALRFNAFQIGGARICHEIDADGNIDVRGGSRLRNHTGALLRSRQIEASHNLSSPPCVADADRDR